MAERRMLLNSTETFVGTMRIEYYCKNGKLYLGLNDNIKIIEKYFDDVENGYYIIGFKKDLIVPEDFIDYNGYCEIEFYSDYNIMFYPRSVYANYTTFHGNFTFDEQSIISPDIHLYDYYYVFNYNCFNTDVVDSIIIFHGHTIKQYYKNTYNYNIYANPHILYDLMKYNNIEEGDEKARYYHIIDFDYKLFISSPTNYITKVPNVDLGNNNYIKSVNNYMYGRNYITQYNCNLPITHLRTGITLPKDATVYFPDTVTTIYNTFIVNNSNLKKVVIFGNCNLTYLDGFDYSSLENIEIYSDKITNIRDSCFNNCTKLIKFIMPKSVLEISYHAFGYCTSLESINYEGTIEEWNNIIIASDWRDSSTIITIHCSDGDIQL